MRLTNVEVDLQLPYIGGIKGAWQPDEREREAAWEMYVELITRVSVVELGASEGLLSEALSSFYALFEMTRGILRKYGPGVAKSKEGQMSFGYLSVTVLNAVLRPLLSRWHPLLADYEARRDPDTSPVDHERMWEKAGELRQEIELTREVLAKYADQLAEAAGVQPLRWPQTSEKGDAFPGAAS
jgi:hypothetical protein